MLGRHLLLCTVVLLPLLCGLSSAGDWACTTGLHPYGLDAGCRSKSDGALLFPPAPACIPAFPKGLGVPGSYVKLLPKVPLNPDHHVVAFTRSVGNSAALGEHMMLWFPATGKLVRPLILLHTTVGREPKSHWPTCVKSHLEGPLVLDIPVSSQAGVGPRIWSRTVLQGADEATQEVAASGSPWILRPKPAWP